MPNAPKTLHHPTFGDCKQVPSLVAIKWRRPRSPKDVSAALANDSLVPATEAPKMDQKASGPARDPRPVAVNQSETLTWATGKSVTAAVLSRVASDPEVEWVAPAYRAADAEPGPQSYFAIDPTVLLLSQQAAATVGEIGALDASASVDPVRSARLKGYVVVSLPNGNAIELAENLVKQVGPQSIAFSNIPYVSPTTACACGGSGHGGASASARECSPATADLVPNDTFYPNSWGLQRINAPRAWPISEGDPNVVVAVLDQGVELGHPDLNLWPVSYSTISHTNDGSPVGNHGTACAGIISAKIDNALGVSGLAGKCRVMAIATNFADTEVAEGLYYAADNGARVVSMSFGVYPSWMIWNFAIIEAALQYCHDRSVVLVAASGNENLSVCRFPGSDPRTITVGGSNRSDVRKSIGDTSIEPWWGACYGPDLEVVAPCLEIPTTDRLGPMGYTATDYDLRFNGTSSATPHVAALAGLLFSVNPSLTSADVLRIVCETADKINAGAYPYLPTAGKPYGTWNPNVGYGRINVERALLVACASAQACRGAGPCGVDVPQPEPCCVSPCDPPWRPDEQCLVWYDTRLLRVPLSRDGGVIRGPFADAREWIEFRITYEHKLCLLGKQHGPLLFTQTLLPGEKVTLYHSDRYRRITSEQDRFSVQTSFMQFLSAVHEGRVTNTLDALSDKLVSIKGSSSVSVGGGLAGLLGLPGGSASTQSSVTDHNRVSVGLVAEQFHQSVVQSSQLTHAERSIVVSNYEEKDVANVTARTIHNDNECRAVTYFIRRVVELYSVSTTVVEISYRIIAPNVLPEWHAINDLAWLPKPVQDQIRALLALLPRIGQVVEKPKPISLPTDGTVYDPELAHCCSCEPERAAAIEIRLEKQKAEMLKACLEARTLELELERRRLLLLQGNLSPFEAPAGTAVPALPPPQ